MPPTGKDLAQGAGSGQAAEQEEAQSEGSDKSAPYIILRPGCRQAGVGVYGEGGGSRLEASLGLQRRVPWVLDGRHGRMDPEAGTDVRLQNKGRLVPRGDLWGVRVGGGVASSGLKSCPDSQF